MLYHRSRLPDSLSVLVSFLSLLFSCRDGSTLVSFSVADAKVARTKMKKAFILNCKTDFCSDLKS